MIKQLSNQQVAELHAILSRISKDPKIPLKVCIAKNVKALTGPLDVFLSKKADLFLESVKTGSDGHPLFDDNYAPTPKDYELGVYPKDAFQYLSDKHLAIFQEAEADLADEMVDVDLYEEDLNREVLTLIGGEVREIPLRDIVEGPESTITPQMIILFSEYFLKV